MLKNSFKICLFSCGMNLYKQAFSISSFKSRFGYFSSLLAIRISLRSENSLEMCRSCTSSSPLCFSCSMSPSSWSCFLFSLNFLLNISYSNLTSSGSMTWYKNKSKTSELSHSVFDLDEAFVGLVFGSLFSLIADLGVGGSAVAIILNAG